MSSGMLVAISAYLRACLGIVPYGIRTPDESPSARTGNSLPFTFFEEELIASHKDGFESSFFLPLGYYTGILNERKQLSRRRPLRVSI